MEADDVLTAISRNVVNVTRQLAQENPDRRNLTTTLQSSITNLRRIAPSLLDSTVSDIEDSLRELLQAVAEEPRLEPTTSTNTADDTGPISRARGRPSFKIDVEFVKRQLQRGYSAKAISDQLGCSAGLIYKTLRDEGLNVNTCKYSAMDDDELDRHVRELHADPPNAGYVMMNGYLRSRGVQVQRQRVRSSLTRVDPPATAQRWSNTISRRTYRVPVPNSLWHMDGHMRLIRWGIVTHGCIDGYSRLITFLKCGANNKSATVLDLFVGAVLEFGLPSRVRSDHGGENIQVALFMNLVRKAGRNNHITGRSVHNQRIERLWRDVHQNVTENFYKKFYDMEDQSILDPSQDAHISAIQLVYIPEINRQLTTFQRAWNQHQVRTESHRSPEQVWMDGMLADTNGHTSVQELKDPSSLHDLDAKLQAFGLSQQDVGEDTYIDDGDRVVLRNGCVVPEATKLELEAEIQDMATLEEKFLFCVSRLQDLEMESLI